MRHCLAVIIACLAMSAQAQNLISNGGFETMKKCPKSLGQLERATGWSSPNAGTPDYFHRCYSRDLETCGVPNNFFGTRGSFEGDGYAGILAGEKEKEYVQYLLSEPLVAGRRYCLRFRAGAPSPMSDGRGAIGVTFADSSVQVGTWDALPFRSLLNGKWDLGVGDMAWATYAANFEARGGEQALIVGHFGTLEGKAYTFLDAFELFETTSPLGCEQVEVADEAEDPHNLVPNPGFEFKFGCPTAREDIHLAKNWSVASNTPDFYHVCGVGTASVPINELGEEAPRSGNGYGGIWVMLQERATYREFVKTRLRQPLVAGRKYCLSIWVSLAEDSDFALDQLQLLVTQPDDNRTCQVGTDTTELVTLRNGQLLDERVGWTFLHGTFVARGGEQTIMIGNFRGNDDPHMHKLGEAARKGPAYSNCAYYYIDDIGLHAVGDPTCSCPPDPADQVAIPEPLPLPAQAWKVGDTLILRNLQFAYDRSELLPGAAPQLDSLADYLQRHPDLRIRITGHTDADGSTEYNQRLSQARAQAVATVLARQGVAAERLTSVGMGEAQPCAPNASEAEKALNRRVEVEFLRLD